MSRYQLEPKPKAVLDRVDEVPIPRSDGATTQRWRTKTGTIHVQVIYPGGRTEWYLLVQA